MTAKPKRTRPGFERSAGLRVAAVAPRASGAVKSAGRVLQVLEFFDEIQREARVAEISQRLSFPQSSTSILLRCLVDLGYLDYQPETRGFLPSPRVALLGAWLDKGPVRDGSLIRMVEEVSRRTGDTVILAARHGIYSQYIHVTQARSSIRFHIPQGSRRLVAWSSTGFALLANAARDDVRALCSRTNAEALPGQMPVVFTRCWENVRSVTTNGYFFSRGLVTPGAGGIAVPLPKKADIHERPLAIAVSGLLNDFVRREGEIVATVKDVIQRYVKA